MQRNKYLDDIGLNIEKYGTNWSYQSNHESKNKWESQRELYGFDDRETYDLDTTFIEWLYSRLMMYKETASKVVDLNCHNISYNGKEYTLIEAIDEILDASKNYLTFDGDSDEMYEYMQHATHLWAEILPYCWW